MYRKRNFRVTLQHKKRGNYRKWNECCESLLAYFCFINKRVLKKFIQELEWSRNIGIPFFADLPKNVEGDDHNSRIRVCSLVSKMCMVLVFKNLISWHWSFEFVKKKPFSVFPSKTKCVAKVPDVTERYKKTMERNWNEFHFARIFTTFPVSTYNESFSKDPPFSPITK